MVKRPVWLTVLLVGCSSILPSLALASGGGPLLVLFSVPAYVAALVLGVPLELLVLRRLVSGVAPSLAIGDVLAASAVSTVVAGLLLPVVVAGIGLVGVWLPDSWGDQLLVAGTWVADGGAHNRLGLAVTIIWFLALLGVSVLLEGWVLRRRWSRRQQLSDRGAFAISALINIPKVIIAVIATFATWRELL